MSIKAQLVQELNNLSEEELEQVAEYMTFIKFRSKLKPVQNLNDTQIAELYAEFGDEDVELAEQGISEYVNGLTKEDSH